MADNNNALLVQATRVLSNAKRRLEGAKSDVLIAQEHVDALTNKVASADIASENKTLKMALHVLMRKGTPTAEELAEIERELVK